MPPALMRPQAVTSPQKRRVKAKKKVGDSMKVKEPDLRTEEIIERMTIEIPKLAKQYGMKSGELWRAIYFTVHHKIKKK